jgi:uncharacterized protein DUF6152
MTKGRAFAGVALAIVLMFFMQAPASAHHSAAAEFDIDKPITMTGVIVKMDWFNPHAWIHLDVKGPDGKVETWSFELAGSSALLRRGWRRTDLPIGTEVTVRGYLARDGVFKTPTATTRDVKLPDGKTLFAGTAPGQ